MGSQDQYLKINKSKSKVQGCVDLMVLEDHGHLVMYVPSLNLSAYGDTFQEANEMIQEVIKDFTESLLSMSSNECAAYLSKFGWEKHRYFNKVVNLSETTFEDIKKQFNIDEDSQVKPLQKFSMAV